MSNAWMNAVYRQSPWLLISLFLMTCLSCDKKRSDDTKNEPVPHQNLAGKTTTDPMVFNRAKTMAIQKKIELPWIEDDFKKARARAIKEKNPLVIDLWAEWCHTCLSMKNYVLNDPSLVALADRFVWLAVDTEKKKNALLLAKYPPSVWPTFLVLGGPEMKVQARQMGATSAAKFREFILLGERGHQDALAQGGSIGQDGPIFWMRLGDRAALAGKHSVAQEAFRTALKKAPADWERRPEIMLATASSLYKAEAWDECVDFGLSVMDQVGNGSAVADLFALTYYCCTHLAENDPRKKSLPSKAIKKLQQICDDQTAPLMHDDRSEVLRVLRVYLDAQGDKQAARKVAEKQKTLLDKAAAEAKSPESAATYNWPRSEVYLYLGVAAELIPALAQSEKDLPKQYDPPYRLAWLLHKLGKEARALMAAQRAIKLAYGPRQARMYGMIADIQLALDDSKEAVAAARRSLDVWTNLPEGQRNAMESEAAQRRLDELIKTEK
jgi:tetratricopeptide (TPR) repeat protein